MNALAKILLSICFLIAISALAIWIIGGQTIKHSTTMLIDASPTAVFPYLVEGEKVQQWSEGVVDVGNFMDPQSESSPSSTARTLTADGKLVTFEDRVIRYKADETISIQSSNSFLVQTSIFMLTSTGDASMPQTQLEYRTKTNHVGLGRIFEPFSKDNVEERMIGDAKRLKDLVESEVDRHAPQPLSSETQTEYFDPNVETASFEEDVEPASSSETNQEDSQQFDSLFGGSSGG
jgi:hypothetical protein